jgi:hypothetical protein
MKKGIFYSLLFVGCFSTSTAQFQFLYPNEEFKKTGVMAFANGIGEVSNERITAGLNAQVRARIHNILLVNVGLNRWSGGTSDLNTTEAVNNLYYNAALLFGKNEEFKGGIFVGYNDGNRNKKANQLFLTEAETGVKYNYMRYTDPSNEDLSIAYTGKIPYYKAGFMMYSSQPEEGKLQEFYFYYCWTSMPQQQYYYSPISYYGVNIPMGYNIEGLAHTTKGFGLNYNMYFLNALNFGVDVGFRPAQYVKRDLEGKAFKEGMFFNMTLGFRVF